MFSLILVFCKNEIGKIFLLGKIILRILSLNEKKTFGIIGFIYLYKIQTCMTKKGENQSKP